MKLFYFLLLLFTCQITFAGTETGNGGDQCEQNIIKVRNAIASWINSDGHINLDFPEKVNSKIYKSKMLNEISNAQIYCINDEVSVYNTSKTCVNANKARKLSKSIPLELYNKIKKTRKSVIVCNTNKLKNIDADEFYRLIHHEYAGLSGFEVNTSAESNYFISDQLSAYLEATVEMRLALEKRDDEIDTVSFLQLNASEEFLKQKTHESVEIVIKKCNKTEESKIVCTDLDGDIEGEKFTFNKVHTLRPGSYSLELEYSNKTNTVKFDLDKNKLESVEFAEIKLNNRSGQVSLNVMLDLSVDENFNSIINSYRKHKLYNYTYNLSPFNPFDEFSNGWITPRDHTIGSYYHSYCSAILKSVPKQTESYKTCLNVLNQMTISTHEILAVHDFKKISKYTYSRLGERGYTRGLRECGNNVGQSGNSTGYSDHVKEYLRNNPDSFVSLYYASGDCDISTIHRIVSPSTVNQFPLKESEVILLTPGQYQISIRNESGGHLAQEINVDAGRRYAF